MRTTNKPAAGNAGSRLVDIRTPWPGVPIPSVRRKTTMTTDHSGVLLAVVCDSGFVGGLLPVAAG